MTELVPNLRQEAQESWMKGQSAHIMYPPILSDPRRVSMVLVYVILQEEYRGKSAENRGGPLQLSYAFGRCIHHAAHPL